MCFKNLPVEFDAAGRAFLREGIADPYATTTAPANVPKQLSHEQITDLLRRNGHIKSVDFDPVTRVAGALAFHTVTDLKARKVVEA
ncbi:MAG: cytochrome C, partial [Longimicrobiales bacterium]